jgi:tetratricopeptide (TPR) repeat protein
MAAATWIGAAVVLACGVWLNTRGGPAGWGPLMRRTPPESEGLAQDIGWMDDRLAAERASGIDSDPRRACRIAALHWGRAVRLAQHTYNCRYDMTAADGREPGYGSFRAGFLHQDASGDVAAARAAARQSLALTPPGPTRARALWLIAMADDAAGRHGEAIGALGELTHYFPRQVWVWRLLAMAYHSQGDRGREELAEEQAWSASTGHPLSAFITRAVRHTPYACLPPRPHGRL